MAAQLWDPGALAVNADGDVLVADQGNRTIRVLTSRPGTFYGVSLAADDLGTVAGEGSYGPYLVDGISAVGVTGEIDFPTAVAVDAHGNLYIADGAIQAIRLVPASTTTLLGKAATADNMYTVAGAMSTDVLHSKTEWIQTAHAGPGRAHPHARRPGGLQRWPGRRRAQAAGWQLTADARLSWPPRRSRTGPIRPSR